MRPKGGNMGWKRWLLAMVLLGVLGACQPAPPPGSPGTATDALPAIAPSATWTPFVPLAPTATFVPTATASPTVTPTATPATVTLLFVGNIVPARCVRAAADRRGDDHYIYAQVAPQIRKADFAVALLNASLTDRIPPTGCVKTYLLVGDPHHADTMAWAGFDAVNMATNHIKNGGDAAFLDTLDAVHQAGLLSVGAGRDLEEALQPLIVELNGIRFAFVALNAIETKSFAGETTPGAAPLTEDNVRKAMAWARQQADVVIALPHWGPEYDTTPDYLQRRAARWLVEAGADVVVGNHPHVVQGMEVIQGVPVFYGLGNFVFDQTWSLETQQGAILTLTFSGTQLVRYTYIPTHTDGDGTVHIAPPAEAEQILARMLGP